MPHQKKQEDNNERLRVTSGKENRTTFEQSPSGKKEASQIAITIPGSHPSDKIWLKTAVWY